MLILTKTKELIPKMKYHHVTLPGIKKSGGIFDVEEVITQFQQKEIATRHIFEII